MTTFTKEQLIENIQHRISVASNFLDSEKTQIDDAIYSIALATLEAPAVMYASQETLDAAEQGEHLLRTLSKPSGDAVIPLYTYPHPAPVVLDSGREQFEEWFKFHHGEDGSIVTLHRANGGANYRDEFVDLAWIAWKDSRAAMQGKAEPVSNRDELTGGIDENLIEALRFVQCMLDDYRENNHGHSQEWIRHIDEKFSEYSETHEDDAYSVLHSLLLRKAAGNSPVIPDGWVACSERMPHIGVPVITCCGDVVQYAVYAWDGKEWQDWYEEYDRLPASTFTHWHSRPAAPQQEAE